MTEQTCSAVRLSPCAKEIPKSIQGTCASFGVYRKGQTTRLSRLTHLRRDEARSIIRCGVLHHRFFFGCFLIRLSVYTNKDKTATDSSLATLSGQAHVLRRAGEMRSVTQSFSSPFGLSSGPDHVQLFDIQQLHKKEKSSMESRT